MKIAFPLSLNLLFWSFIGLVRFFWETAIVEKRNLSQAKFIALRRKTAICLPAHNEEEVIRGSIKSIQKQIPSSQIYVVSDGSSDRTAEIARSMGCNVMENAKGNGKAKALKGLMKKNKLLSKFDFIVFVDADTKLDNHYLDRALRYMKFNPEVAALAAHANPYWRHKTTFGIGDFITAYRTRLYRILQLTFMYGQTWKYANVNVVIPGFAAMYRSRVLKKLELDTKGVWIEDFNLAFQVHKKKLGRIAYIPGVSATYKDPNSIEDYWNQVRRWNVGFFQTVKAQGIWPSIFWVSAFIFTLELFLFSFFVLTAPILVILLLLPFFSMSSMENDLLGFILFPQGYDLAVEALLGVLFFDYLVTIAVALKDKKYRLIIYGPFFIFFQILNSLILITSLKKGFFGESSGIWRPAKRT